MKPATRNTYAERIDRVVARLQQAVVAGGELPDLPELAAIAHLSSFHFHRVYRALTGETIGRTVARLRLLRALHLLGDAQASITGIAMTVGYETPQAFARAFRDAFAASPSELRAQPARMADELQRLSRPPERAGRDDAPLRVDVVSVEPFEVVALRNRGAYEDLDQAYWQLMNWAIAVGIADTLSGLYGIPLQDHRDVPAGEVEFDCAMAFSTEAQPPAPMRRLQVGGGGYARARHVGSFGLLEDATDRLLAEWLPGSGHALRDVPIHYGYLDDPEEVPEAMLRTDIFIPVQ
ncbi:transcriptional regulator, AraC family [Luteimonas cucumeris]|uniref:Transcriptional regulator, AraC family n=1 Tax=Luteimonas cucumeris TaxID=985012 RepID=A0A562L5E4_9GAMM|nr:GyrI-like domain-containing protein [Luteimonas cucumeris]TWI02861.1 transcriptional regulator, AraC family [Luteimonas cucumeris]